jgi:hypothetical protein
LETIIAYAPAGAGIQNTLVPFDGNHITFAILGKQITASELHIEIIVFDTSFTWLNAD